MCEVNQNYVDWKNCFTLMTIKRGLSILYICFVILKPGHIVGLELGIISSTSVFIFIVIKIPGYGDLFCHTVYPALRY